MKIGVTNKGLHKDNGVKGGNSMNKKKKRIGLIVLLLLFGITAGYVANTYAKYTSQVNGSGTVKVAKWAFDTDNSSIDIDIDLTGNIDASTLVSERIAPGTSGSFDIELSNENSEVGVEFTITLSNSNAPTNLVFDTGTTITGTIAQGDTLTIPVGFSWAYETTNGDADDTADGIAANDMTITASIVGTQVQPGAAISTQYN